MDTTEHLNNTAKVSLGPLALQGHSLQNVPEIAALTGQNSLYHQECPMADKICIQSVNTELLTVYYMLKYLQ